MWGDGKLAREVVGSCAPGRQEYRVPALDMLPADLHPRDRPSGGDLDRLNIVQPRLGPSVSMMTDRLRS